MSTLNILKHSLFFLLLTWQLIPQAQDVKMFSGKAPSAEEMGDILFSESNGTMGGIKMRSISFGKANTKETQTPEKTSEQNSVIGLPIKFEYDSALVLDDSKSFLNEIGRMLSMPNFANEKLMIEGHTDAGGSEMYNRSLSEKRAKSVKLFLENNYNIAKNRLFIIGMGESQPLPKVDPYAPINRRVQLRKAP